LPRPSLSLQDHELGAVFFRAALKALDRYDNLLRRFGIQDQTYHRRLLDETRRYYNPIVAQEPRLVPIRGNFELIQDQISATLQFAN
jgi:hypothetical protein